MPSGDGGGGGGDAGIPDAGEDAAPPDAAGPTRTITGVARRRHVSPGGEVVAAVDLTGTEISALASPSFTSYPGSGDASGAFTVPDVPVGTYYLKLGDQYFVATEDSVDLGIDVLGRADAEPAVISPTDLVLDLDNLDPWQTGDELQMFAAGSGTVGLAMQNGASAGLPLVDDTVLGGFTYDVTAALDPYLIDGDSGDELIVTQLATATTGVYSFRRVTRAFTPAAFTMVDGETTSLTGVFADVPQTETFAFEWDRSAFAATLHAGAPLDGALVFPFVVLHTLPEAAERGTFGDSADIVQFVPGWTDDTSIVEASFGHGDPFPAEWSRVVTAALYSYRYVGVGDAAPMPIYSVLQVELDRAAVSADTPIEPMVGPVLSPRVAGRDAFGTLDGIGTIPTISWDPPAVGTASRYYVVVVELVDEGGSTEARRVASLETSATSIDLPPGILQSGSTYFFYIGARETPGVDLEATPFRGALPTGGSRIATSLATP